MGKTEDAKGLFNNASSKGTPFYLSDYYYSMGQLFETQKDAKKAAENYERSLKENPFNVEAATMLHRLLISNGQKTEAEKTGKSMRERLNQVKTLYRL